MQTREESYGNPQGNYHRFNPRKQRWSEHFAWSNDFTLIIGLTLIERATVETLWMNDQKMVHLRHLLVLAGLHP